MKVLAINTEFNNTDIALFENSICLWVETQSYELADLEQFPTLLDQEGFRCEKIKELLSDKEVNLHDIAVFASTGGMLRPLDGGVYSINSKMIQDIRDSSHSEYPPNLGAVLAANLANRASSRYAFIADPPVVDEMNQSAHMTGLPDISRKSVFKALLQKSAVRKEAKRLGKSLEKCRFVVCYIGNGASVCAHSGGSVIEANDIYGGLGPMSLERAGTLPSIALIDLCFSGKYSQQELKTRVIGVGGFAAYLGTNDTDEIVRRVRSGERRALFIFEAFVRDVLMNIGGCAALLGGDIDGILLMGRMAKNPYVCTAIEEQVKWLAPVSVYSDEDELQPLVDVVIRVMMGVEEANIYA